METVLWRFHTVCTWLSWNSFPEFLSHLGPRESWPKGASWASRGGSQAGASWAEGRGLRLPLTQPQALPLTPRVSGLLFLRLQHLSVGLFLQHVSYSGTAMRVPPRLDPECCSCGTGTAPRRTQR